MRGALIRRLAAAVAAVALLVSGEAAQARTATAMRAKAAAATLDARWGIAGGWRGLNAWQRFVVADILMDYVEATGENGRLPRLYQVIATTRGLDGVDDDLWAVLSWLHAGRLSGDPGWRRRSQSAFDAIVSQYWDDRCGGGLWWDHARTYKNAITNALLIKPAAELYRATGQVRYRRWAESGWRWFRHSGMIGPTGLANDGLDAACHNNGAPTYTYVQGVLIDGLAQLGRVTQEPARSNYAEMIARNTLTRLSRKGLLTEPARKLGRDGPLCKGILVSALGRQARFWRSSFRVEKYLSFNADRVWRTTHADAVPTPSAWGQANSPYGAAAQASVLALYVAAWWNSKDEVRIQGRL